MLVPLRVRVQKDQAFGDVLQMRTLIFLSLMIYLGAMRQVNVNMCGGDSLT